MNRLRLLLPIINLALSCGQLQWQAAQLAPEDKAIEQMLRKCEFAVKKTTKVSGCCMALPHWEISRANNLSSVSCGFLVFFRKFRRFPQISAKLMYCFQAEIRISANLRISPQNLREKRRTTTQKTRAQNFPTQSGDDESSLRALQGLCIAFPKVV